MAFDVPKAIEKIAEAVKSGFSLAEKSKEHQSETEIIKDRKKLQTAVNCAEKLILIMYPYFESSNIDKDEHKDFEKLLEKFIENN